VKRGPDTRLVLQPARDFDAVIDRPCYKNCICLELVLDAKGEKMSKSKGNVVKPMDVVKLHGADALRWYCYTSARPVACAVLI